MAGWCTFLFPGGVSSHVVVGGDVLIESSYELEWIFGKNSTVCHILGLRKCFLGKVIFKLRSKGWLGVRWGLPWRSSGWDSVLPLKGTWVQSLVRELRSYTGRVVQQNCKTKQNKKQLDEEEVYIFWRACEFDGSWFWKKIIIKKMLKPFIFLGRCTCGTWANGMKLTESWPLDTREFPFMKNWNQLHMAGVRK